MWWWWWWCWWWGGGRGWRGKYQVSEKAPALRAPSLLKVLLLHLTKHWDIAIFPVLLVHWDCLPGEIRHTLPTTARTQPLCTHLQPTAANKLSSPSNVFCKLFNYFTWPWALQCGVGAHVCVCACAYMPAFVCVMQVLMLGFLWFELLVITAVVTFHLWCLNSDAKLAFCTGRQALILH